MTINVTLVTSDALIMGCDSIASTSQLLVDPMKILKRDTAGNFIKNDDGRYAASFDRMDMQSVVTHSVGSVQKMFLVHKEWTSRKHDEPVVAAVTSGLAALQERTMHSLAAEFCNMRRRKKLKEVKEIVEEFMDFIDGKYDAHNRVNEIPPEFRDEIEFLIGGFGHKDQFPSVFRISLKEKKITPLHGPKCEAHTGIGWGGQALAVQRLMYGYDVPVMTDVQKIIDDLYADMSNATTRILNDTITALKQPAPTDINMTLPPKPNSSDLAFRYTLDIDTANMPLQYGIELVAYLVNQESGRQKFTRGVMTVGGRTHIGVITKSEGYRELNKPELEHRHVGYHRD